MRTLDAEAVQDDLAAVASNLILGQTVPQAVPGGRRGHGGGFAVAGDGPAAGGSLQWPLLCRGTKARV